MLRSPRNKVAGIAASVALVAGVAWAAWSASRPEPRGIESLWAAVGDRRPVEGRLGGQPYAPFEPRQPLARARDSASGGMGEGGEAASSSEPPTLKRAAAEIFSEASGPPTPPKARSLGALELVRGEVGDAVARLERAAESFSGDAGTQSDLAAAYLERARAGGRVYDLVLAFEVANRAAEADPASLEARWNRALALERLHLKAPARDAWRSYADADPDSGWAAEARERAAALEAPPELAAWAGERERLDAAAAAGDEAAVREIVGRFPHPARLHAWDAGLGEWADAVAEGRGDAAARPLAAARLVGDALVDLHADNWVRDAVAAIDGADPKLRATLVEAHRAVHRGRASSLKSEMAAALASYVAAERLFELAGEDAGLAAALLGRAVGEFWSEDRDATLATLGRLRGVAEARGYPYLLGRERYIASNVHLTRLDLVEAVGSVEAALRAMESVADFESQAALQVMLGDAWREIGNTERMYAHAVASLSVLNRLDRPRLAVNILNLLAWRLVQHGHLALALEVQHLAVDAATWHGDDYLSTEMYLTRAAIRHRLGDEERAWADFDGARQHAGRVEDAIARLQMGVNMHLTEGELRLAVDPAAAVDAATRALSQFEGEKNPTSFWRGHLLRSRARARAGDAEGAEADLLSAIAVYERLRHSLQDAGDRASYFEPPQAIFDEMVALQLDQRRNAEAAFAYAEASRSRVLLDMLDLFGRSGDKRETALRLGRGSSPVALADVRRALDGGVVLLEYAILRHETVCWVVTSERCEAVRLPVGEAGVDALVRRLADAFESGSEARILDAADDVHGAVLEPVRARVPEGARLVVVPDKALHGVPFGALRDRAAGRFLVEDHVVLTAPSASVYARSAARDRSLAGAGGALVVGNPAFDRVRFPRLGGLEDAEREAGEIAALYPGATLLLGEDATAAAFLDAAPGSSAVHFAGHAVSDPDVLIEPGLVFAPGGADDRGVLSASDLYAARLDGVRLVVLAACRTSAGASLGREGISSLARAFLAAGAPAVVASLFDADDRASARLFTEFHHRRAAGLDPAAALREAQLALLRGSDERLRSPSKWGVFQLAGGCIVS